MAAATWPPEVPLSVTLVLCAFNQQSFIRQAVLSALAQTYSPLEVILSDDCSSDDTFNIIDDVVRNYAGPHTVKVNRNPLNLGLIAHVNRLVELASGELIVVAAGDDISLPHRVERLVAAYEDANIKPMLIHSRAVKIDDRDREAGILTPPMTSISMPLKWVAESQALYLGATGCWHRDIFRKFGPIRSMNAYEDLVQGFRAALLDRILYIDEPLIKYRIGVGLSSGALRQPRLNSMIAQRKKGIRTMLAVYQQRLSDLFQVGDPALVALLSGTLETQIILQQRRLLFYSRPRELFASWPKDHLGLTIFSVAAETKQLIIMVGQVILENVQSLLVPRQ